MTASPLRQFIAELEAAGDLSRIPVPVDPVMEIAAITGRICKRPDGGSALFFEQPTGSSFPVATNLFGSAQRVCRALGIAGLDELTIRLSALLDLIAEPGDCLLAHRLAGLSGFSRFAPHRSSETDPALTAMNPPDMTTLPFLQSWPKDGAAEGHARYITLPQVITASPDGSMPNCGVYRAQVRGRHEVAIQWKAGSGGAHHAELHRIAGKKMPVAITLGGEPAILFSAMFPLPGDLDEITFAGFLLNRSLATNSCQSIPLQAPSGAEIVIEGHVEPGEFVTEGPFGNHSGFYAPAAPAALMRVTSIRHRADAVVPATIVGPPPMEDCRMAQAWERLLLAFLRKLVPSVTDIHFPLEWVFHQSAIISLETPRPDMIRNIVQQLWNLKWFATARVIVLVDADTSPLDISRAAWKTINMVSSTDNILHDTETGRVAIDATASHIKRNGLKESQECAALLEKRWKEYGLA